MKKKTKLNKLLRYIDNAKFLKQNLKFKKFNSITFLCFVSLKVNLFKLNAFVYNLCLKCLMSIVI